MTCTRGTSNSNERGNVEDRRRRRAWLVDTYRADRDLVYVVRSFSGTPDYPPLVSGFHVDNLPRHPMHGQTAASMVEDHLNGYRNEALGDDHVKTLAWTVPACRCYRCGVLLSIDTVTVDRIIPGVKGGTYRRNNIRPACGGCNSETGGALASRPSGRTKR